MRTRFLIPVAAPLFVLVAYGQQFPPAYPGDDDTAAQQQQSPAANCSDPSIAGSPACASMQGGSMNSPNLSAPSQGAILPGQPSHITTYSDVPNQVSRPRQPQPALRLEALTEFQQFVASTTGQVLPIFGASQFQNVPSTFAPLENAPVTPDYVVGPDDELRVRVWGQVNFNANLQVDRSGDIFIPQIGQVHVSGLRFDQVQQHIHDEIASVYRNFQLLVDLGRIRSMQVYVTGEARRPGVYTVSSLSTLVDALFASGGPSVEGSLRAIELRRSGAVVATFDLYALLVSGDKSRDAKLQPGDVIFIPPAGKQIAVTGSVRRRAIYEMLPGDTLAAVLRDAGGITSLASEAHASLDRTVESSSRQTVEVRLDTAGLATPLEDGDILQITSLVSKYRKTVTLRGNTANPGRYAWHDGMKLSDLVPDRDSLLTRDYWWRRVQLGLPALEFEPVPALTNMRQPSSPVDLRRLPPNSPAQQAFNAQQGISPQATSTQAGANQDVYQAYMADQAGAATQQSSIPNSSTNQPSAPTQSSQSALAQDDFDRTAPLTPLPTQRTEVRQTSPDIDWSYGVIERTDTVTLKTTLVPFDLGKLVIDRDPEQDLALQPGDVVNIFSQSDIHVPIAEQTTLVRLEGEFVHSGTYSALPGETLRALIERAGGLTPNAYLYGSVFTRESTRVLQQRRIDESVREMALQMQRGNLALAASPVSNAQDLASVSAAQGSEQALLAQLQQIRANGRIVLPFVPDSTSPSAVPDIKLENGDTFLVPSVPSTVNVLGAVFNQNSFIYRPHAQVRAILDLAGGPNSDADRHRMFVIRANGAVVSRTVVKGAWGDEFFRLHLNPGDTIIVPEKTIKPGALRGLLDWTQIFSQLAFGAAAINVLR